ncbi:hypothetical protein N356_gp056 [Cellulophaga phage phi14:2]|uniref:Uncharacterized protein n=1 Tax=Cellulophaga phage phi14:2 TaxID=1327990 RepID=S0A3Z0_9CAUD|nr:hypothetical protein N356_gp056 [Cellulophaga phage phi14:2]AGO48948.1 hypothetical protein Phi14:2_gp070 [Cellulophaga phage phi14:2]
MKITIRDYHIASGWIEDENPKFELIEEIINSAEESDGGRDLDIVLRHTESSKFYGFNSTDWEINWEHVGEGELDNEIPYVNEVFQKTKTIIVYEQ